MMNIDENCTIVETKASKGVKTVLNHTKAVVSLKYSLSGRLLAAAGADKRTSVIDAEGNIVLTLQYSDSRASGINDIAWIDEKYLVNGADDGSLRVWDIKKKVSLMAFSDNTSSQGAVYSIDVDKYTGRVFSGKYNGTLSVYDISSQSAVFSFVAHSDPLSSVSVSPDGIDVATCGHDGVVRIWDSRFLSCCKCTIGAYSNPPISCIRYSDNGQYLLITSLDSRHRLFNVSSKPLLQREYYGHINSKFMLQSCFVSLQDDNNYVISGSEDGQVLMWNVDQSDKPFRLSTDSNSVVYSTAFYSDTNRNQLSFSRGDGSIVLVDNVHPGVESDSKDEMT